MPAVETALPASVPPTPPTSISSRPSPSQPRLARTRSASSGRIPHAPAGTPAAIVLPTTTTSGRSPSRAVIPPGPAHRVWVSSMTSRVPVRSQAARTASCHPGSGSTIPMFVIAGSMSTAATSPDARAASSAGTSLNGTTTVVASSGTGAPMLPRRETTRPSSSSDRIGLVDGAVVAVVDHEHLGTTGRLPRVPQHVPVGVGRRQRELPARQAEPFREQPGGDGRVGGREHEGGALCEPPRDRVDRRRRGVPDHRAGVAEAEIHVVEAVGAGEVGARGGVDEDRPGTRPLRHPEHRHAVRHALARLAPELFGTRMLRAEPLGLVRPEPGEAVAVRVHCDQPRLARRRRRAPAASWVATTRMIARKNTNEAITFAWGGMPRAAAM